MIGCPSGSRSSDRRRDESGDGYLEDSRSLDVSWTWVLLISSSACECLSRKSLHRIV
jgi:hypothetical protein